jgi:hypothetical protein
MNAVIQYDDSTAITTTPEVFLDFPQQQYTMLRVKNETGVDVNMYFSKSTNEGLGAKYVVKADDDLLQAFDCTGKVSLSVDTGSTIGNFFVQLTKG